uniref:Putative salivary kunitz domain protein n=1 Tax=Ixodes ricinus TaxID=34613 RepID=A0A0K8RHJ7_IXORI
MQYNIFWIFVIAAFGVCHCDDSTDDGDTDDSSSSAEEGRCNGSPYYLRGLMRQRGWFYDQTRDECRLYYFGDNNWNEGKNKFRTVEECRKTCRSKCVTHIALLDTKNAGATFILFFNFILKLKFSPIFVVKNAMASSSFAYIMSDRQ